MRIDVVTIFPAYLAPLELSLAGKARDRGLLDVRVHDLRGWTTDRHHTVDDTPYGGGAGMVMKPEPWGAALDDLLGRAEGGSRPTIVVPTPSGVPFSQALARDLATRERLLFACGRYEGIDQRVLDHAGERAEVLEVSIGDYVLNGGEVAALAITEAVVRLLPGFMGNPASLTEESHEDGLLEYPVYTKPASWRGHDVPPVLLSGDHRAIAAWRHEQAVRRTVERRPDLAHPASIVSPGSEQLELRLATRADAGELFTLQRACWVTEAESNRELTIPALVESMDDVHAGLEEWQTWLLRASGRLIGSVRARLDAPTGAWEIGRLMVAPDLVGRGLGRWLLAHAEGAAPAGATSYSLVTGAGSSRNLRLYRKAGYRLRGEAPPGVARLTKPVDRGR